jgi:hypothetical protein
MYPESPVTSDGYNLQMKTGVVAPPLREVIQTAKQKFFLTARKSKVDRLSSNRHIGAGAEGDE